MIAFTLGVLGIALYYIPHQGAQAVLTTVTKWDRIIAGFSLFLGIYSLMHLHAQKIRRRESGWGFSGIIYIGFLITLSVGLYNKGGWFWSPRAVGGGLDWIYNNIQYPCSATMFSMLAFFIASAAYRTFRARTFEAALLLVSAIVVMLGRVPIGEVLSSWFPVASAWLMEVPNLAAKRGILLGVCLGGIATSLRIIFGIERAYLGGEE